MWWPFRGSTRPSAYRPALLLQQLEDRIVLDAAVNSAPDHQPVDQIDTTQGATSADHGPAPASGQPTDANAGLVTQLPEHFQQVFGENLNVVLISNNLADVQAISHAAADHTQVIQYDQAHDNLATITATLQELVATTGHKIDNLAIVGHGTDGVLNLGTDQIQLFGLSTYRAGFEALGQTLSPDAQIQFYTCSLAGNAWGQGLVNQIALYTVADVFASVDTTGGPSGNWVLEYSTDTASLMHPVFNTDGLAAIHSELDNVAPVLNLNSGAGSLDPTFSGDGQVTTDFGTFSDTGWSVAIQTDGKIVVAGSSNGDFAVARYNIDGSLDMTFDMDGRVTTDLGSSSDMAFSVAIQADGRIVVAGATNYMNPAMNGDFALVRYTSNGSLDTSFDFDGKVTTDFGSLSDVARSVAIQADGKIVAAGWSSASSQDFALARYNTDGSLDGTFDFDGKVTTDFATYADAAFSVAIQSDGKIVAAGRSANGAAESTTDVAVVRYNTNGSLDTTFDFDGKVTTDFAGLFDFAFSVAIQTDGKIVAAGGTNCDFFALTGDIALVRYTSTGGLDTTFDGDGKVITDSSDFADWANDVAIQADGKIVAASASNSDFTVLRYTSTGSLDTTFDGDGKVITNFSDFMEQPWSVAIQSDGKIVAAGMSGDSSADFALARYNTNGSLDTTFQFDGTVITDFGNSYDHAYSVAI